MNEDFSHWAEWRAKCDLTKCSLQAQIFLKNFADKIFNYWLKQIDPNANVPSTFGGESYAWEIFEQKMLTGITNEGKRYKDDLIEAAHGIESRASGRLRDCVRSAFFFTKKKVVTGAIEIDGAFISDPDAPTLRELFNPFHLTAQNELQAEARKMGEGIFDSLNLRQKMALIAIELGLSLSLPELEAIFECKQSMRYSAYSSIRMDLLERFRQWLPDEDKEIYELLTDLALNHLQEKALQWGMSEKTCEPLFHLGEQNG